MADSIELWTDSIEPVARAVAASNPRALSAEVATISIAISAKRIADALEATAALTNAPMIPDNPIYWSDDERERLMFRWNMKTTAEDAAYAVANEVLAILRDRGKTP